MAKLQKHSKIKNSKAKELIVVDQVPIRRSAFNRFNLMRQRYLGLKNELHTHKELVRASYSVWFFNSFQNQLAHIEKLERLQNEKLTLIHRIEEIYEKEDLTYLEATELAEKEMEDAKKMAERSQDHQESMNSSQSGGSDDPEDEDSARLDEDLRNFRDSASSAHTDDDTEFFGKGLLYDVQNVQTSSHDGMIKFYFRKIAQVVHPDTANRTETGEVESEVLLKQLWEEATVAEKYRDLETLKMIYSVLLGQSGRVNTQLTLTEIDEQIKVLQGKVKRLEKERHDLIRNDSSWGFEQANKIDLTRVIEIEFNSALRNLQLSLRKILQRLAFLKGNAKVIKRRKPQSKHSSKNSSKY